MVSRSNTIPSCFHVRLWERIRVWFSDLEKLFFVVLIVVHLMPIWMLKYFPSQDGPVHLYNANIIREYHHPDRSVYREYYAFNKNLDPNWLGHLVLAGLMYVVPMLIAEKILLSGYIILLPISIRYALRAIRPDTGFLAFLAFPFIYNYLFHMGFYYFSYSLPMFFLVVGFWLKYRDRFTLRETMILSFLSLLLYFCHLVSLVMAYVAIGLFALWLILLDLGQQISERQYNVRALWKAVSTRALVPLYSFLPTLVLVTVFLLQKGTQSFARPPAWELRYRLISLNSLVSYEKQEIWFSTAFAALFAAVFLYLFVLKGVRWHVNHWDGLLLIFAAYIILYFTAPKHMSGGSFISHRMNLYPFFALILWFGAQSYHRIVKLKIGVVAAGIALVLLGLHTAKYVQINDYLEEYLSGTHIIEPNTTLLPLCFSHQVHPPHEPVLLYEVSPFLHASAYATAQRHVVNLLNYEATTGYFPIIFRPNLDPFKHIGIGAELALQPPRVDFLTYPQRTGGRVDYVLVWCMHELESSNEDTKSIFRQLEEGYELIYVSSQRGFMQLYRRKDWQK